jgi:rhodanese-related sulfurtransferase
MTPGWCERVPVRGLGLVALFLSVALDAAWSGAPASVAPEALDEWLDDPEPPLVLDVRGTAAYLQGTIVGAVDAGTDPLGFLPDSRGGDAVLIPAENALVDAWGARLTDYGYRVHVLAGGMRAWIAAGLPVERPDVGFVRPGTVPFVIPRGICELNEPAQVFE